MSDIFYCFSEVSDLTVYYVQSIKAKIRTSLVKQENVCNETSCNLKFVNVYLYLCMSLYLNNKCFECNMVFFQI